jgi:hypothetical protein
MIAPDLSEVITGTPYEAISQHIATVEEHIRYVREYGTQLMIDPVQLAIHDQSKFTETELIPYTKRFVLQQHDQDEWNAAYLHHIHNNPHHWQHWIVPNTDRVARMPDRYVLEMVADWQAANKVYDGSDDMEPWLVENLHKVKLHPESGKLLLQVLTDLGYNQVVGFY